MDIFLIYCLGGRGLQSTTSLFSPPNKCTLAAERLCCYCSVWIKITYSIQCYSNTNISVKFLSNLYICAPSKALNGRSQKPRTRISGELCVVTCQSHFTWNYHFGSQALLHTETMGESFNKHTPVSVPKYSDLTNTGCDLDTEIFFKALWVI